MKIIHAVPRLGEEANGPSYSVPRLASALARRGHAVQLATIGEPALAVDSAVQQLRYSHTLGSWPVVRDLCLSEPMRRGLEEEARTADVLHAHSLWLMPNVYPGWAAARAGKPLVLSPRGTLGAVPLQYSRLKKTVFWSAMQGRVVRGARCLHATAESEYEEVRALGLKQPVAIVPNGIDLPAAPDVATPPAPRAEKRLLFLGRLHQKKGLEMLLAAWREAGLAARGWRLRIAGLGAPAYENELKASLREGFEGVDLLGPLYGADKADEYASADLFVLPSYNENFGMAVAEALSFGVPVITTTGTPWRGVSVRDCGWWVAPERDAIVAALNAAAAAPPGRLRQMGARGREWMRAEFSWEGVAEQMEAVYRWLVHGGEAPAHVRLD